MFILTVIGIAALSIVLALYSVKRQANMKELKKVKKELTKKRVIYQRESSV